MSNFLNNIALTLENLIGAQLSEGEYRLGVLDLKPLSEIAPLNQTYEALLIHCKNCGKSTAFLSLGGLDHYLDDEKMSIISCRHCHLEIQVPKVQKIRDLQGGETDFIQTQVWKPSKILSKRGQLTEILQSKKKIALQISDNVKNESIEIVIPENKLKLLQTLQIGLDYRLKIQVLESQSLDLHSVLLKKYDPTRPSLIPTIKYQLLSISQLKS
jgi:hypothetical protein